jgi:PAS domain S-box-containing protein
VGAYLVSRFARGRRAFERVPDIFRFALLAALFSTTLSATIGVTSLSLGGYAAWNSYGPIWWAWWLGDMTGDLIVAPFLILWAEQNSFSELRGRGIETALCLLSTVAIGAAVFGGLLHSPSTRAQLVFLCIPFLTWAVLRLGRQIVATSILLLSVLAITTTLLKLGPFSGAVANASLLWLQPYMAVMVVSLLPAAAVVRERTLVTAALRRSEKRYRLLAESIPQVVFSLAPDGRAHYANQRWFSYTGMKPDQSLDLDWLSAVHPEDRGASIEKWQRSLTEGRPFETEFRLRGADGTYRWHLGRSLPWRGSGGRITRWIGTCTDIDDVKRLEADRADLLSREQAARIHAEANVSMLRRLEMVTDTALSGGTLEALLDALTERLRQALDSDTATILLLAADGQHLVQYLSHGLREGIDEPVRIPVGDTGQGISPDFLPHVFERFQQAESGLTRAHGGLGLGLAIVRHLVDLHGGTVTAASDGEGKGATFTVRLPRSLTMTPPPLP